MPMKKSAPPRRKLPKTPPRKPRKRKGSPVKRVELTATKEAVAEQLKFAFNVLINQAHRGENADEEQSRKASMFIKSWCRQHAQHITHAAVEIEYAEAEIQQLEMDLEDGWDDEGWGTEEDRDAEYQIQNLEEEISYSEDDYWEGVDMAVDELRKMGIDVDIKSHKSSDPPDDWKD